MDKKHIWEIKVNTSYYKKYTSLFLECKVCNYKTHFFRLNEANKLYDLPSCEECLMEKALA